MSGFSEHQMDAVEEAVYSHTVGIVPKEGSTIGSGVAISWGARQLILTAEHVIRKIPQDALRFFVRPAAPLQQRQPDGSRQASMTGASIELEVESIVKIEERDLAVVELSKRVKLPPMLDFFSLSQHPPTLPTRGSLFVFGFASQAGLDTSAGRTAGIASEWTRVVNREDTLTLRHFDPRTYFLVEWDLGRHRLHPGGLAGSGIWWHQSSTSESWAPNLALGGICATYLPERRLLKYFRIEVVRELLLGIKRR